MTCWCSRTRWSARSSRACRASGWRTCAPWSRASRADFERIVRGLGSRTWTLGGWRFPAGELPGHVRGGLSPGNALAAGNGLGARVAVGLRCEDLGLLSVRQGEHVVDPVHELVLPALLLRLERELQQRLEQELEAPGGARLRGSRGGQPLHALRIELERPG